MKEIKICEKTIRVRATPLALFFYRKEFKSDLLSDLIKLSAGMLGLAAAVTGSKIEELKAEELAGLNASSFDMAALSAFDIDVIGIMQITWAMAKADSLGERFPSFEKWFLDLGDFDVLGGLPSLLAALEVAASGFLRRGAQQGL
ncbi:hypothetical protein ACOBQJ_13135 [Pelotomaculum propionicicum]|uniref:hypothetical protein n=1 Tax=Pelotomaculum propionicicum TaxID=258475 RepID=UPI003B79F464